VSDGEEGASVLFVAVAVAGGFRLEVVSGGDAGAAVLFVAVEVTGGFRLAVASEGDEDGGLVQPPCCRRG